MPAEETAPSAASYAHMTQDRGKPFRLAGDTISVHRQTGMAGGPYPGRKLARTGLLEQIPLAAAMRGGRVAEVKMRGKLLFGWNWATRCRPEMQPGHWLAARGPWRLDRVRCPSWRADVVPLASPANPGQHRCRQDAGANLLGHLRGLSQMPQELRRPSASFLRQHYTTGSTEASAMAAYLAAVGSFCIAADGGKISRHGGGLG